MSIELLELAETTLGDLVEQVVFIGSATLGLWITDPAAPPVRPTNDVDVVVEVTTRIGFYEFEQQLRDTGFAEDIESGVICRWRHGSGLILDAMPARPDIFGFDNRWQAASIPHAVVRRLPSGSAIRAAQPAYLLAMKLEAFKGRGKGDFLGSRDFADIVTLLDGRRELLDEVSTATPQLRKYVALEVRELMSTGRFMDGLSGAMQGDAASQERIALVLLPAFQQLAAAAG